MIFDGISCQIPDQARLGLVGNNGAGKTTLLRVMMGEVEPDDGTIERSKGLTLGYLPQDLVDLEPVEVLDFLKDRVGIADVEARLRDAESRLARTDPHSQSLPALLDEHMKLERRFEHLGGFAFEAMALKVLSGLGFSRADAAKNCADFSGGWKMRLSMAALLLEAPDVLLLDEPTNHLDTESMEWLEGWLRGHKGAIVAVSHDRRFLENMTTQIADLDRGSLTLYPYGYDRYLVEKRLARERTAKSAEEQKKRVAEIERFVSRFRYKSSKAAQVQSRLKRLEKMDLIELDGPAREMRFRIPEAPESGRVVLKAEKLSKHYGENDVFDGLDFEVLKGEKVALVGTNGAGKSTLLRLLSETEAPTSGTVTLGHNVKIAFYSQESARNVNYSRTVWEEARAASSTLNDAARRSLLGAFLFTGEDIHKSVSILSGGEKARLALYKLMLEETNFLVLDEPTNHLDQLTRSVVQDALLQYRGTLLIVSHDRHFLDSLAERVLELREGKLYDYPGNYSWFLEKREEALARENEAARDEAAVKDRRSREERRRLAAERARVQEATRELRKKRDELDRQAGSLKARIEEIDRELCSPGVHSDTSALQELMVERSSAEKTLEAVSEDWLSLALQIEEAEEKVL